jgi:hypothetical protein
MTPEAQAVQEQIIETAFARISPSALKVWRRCKRKWAFKYIQKLKEPTSAKQQFGTDGHTHLESWIRAGTPPPNTETGRAAKQLIRGDYIPAPSPELVPWVEKQIVIDMGHIHPKTILFGYSDLIVPPTLIECAVVTDYKFTGSMRYAMSPSDIEKDPQGLIYGRYAMNEFGSTKAKARFLYSASSNPTMGPRQPNGSRKVEVEFDSTLPVFQKGWGEIERDVEDIVHAKLAWKTAAEAPYNADACGDFGGCPFEHLCKKPKGASVAALAAKSLPPTQQDEEPMSLMAKLKAQKAAKASLATPAPKSAPKAVPAPNAVPAPKPVEPPAQGSLMDRLRAKNKTEGVNPPPKEAPAVEAEVSTELDKISQLNGMKLIELKKLAKVVGIKGFSTMSKPDLVGALVAETIPNEDPGLLAWKQRPQTPLQIDHDKNGAGCKARVRVDGRVAECENDECKWGRLINSKGEIDVTEAPVAEAETAAPEAAPPNPVSLAGKVKIKIKAPAPTKAAEFMVLIDCVPSKGIKGINAHTLSEWLTTLTDKVAKDNGVAHWGLCLRASAELAGEMEAAFTINRPHGSILVDSNSPQARAVMDVLVKWADVVIQGVR